MSNLADPSRPTRPAIAWIGLGIMGSPMSENLIKAGYDVTGFTLEQEKLDRLTAAGGITTQAEIDELDGQGVDSVVGMAVYTGRLDITPPG